MRYNTNEECKSISGPHVLIQTNQFTCTGRASGFYANPSDCSEYYICAAGLSFSVQCANRLHFNAKTKYCDWPRLAQCAPNSHVQQNTQGPASTTKYHMQTAGPVQTSATLNPLFPWLLTHGPATQKPTTHMTVPQQPVTQAPVTQRPATQPPATQPPATQNVQLGTKGKYLFHK